MATPTYSKAYYEMNKVAMLAQMKAYRERNPEKVKENQRLWRENHEGNTYLDKSTGYINYIGYKHPATSACGITKEHRIILWDKLGGKGAMCYWKCGLWVSWGRKYPEHKDALVVDHLNLDKSDNDPDNLVPSCQACNSTRDGGRVKAVHAQGEDNRLSKITNEDAVEIKTRLINGEDAKVIALDYPIDSYAIHSIHLGRSWKGIGPDMAGTYTPSFVHTDDMQKIELVARVKAGQTLTYIAEEMGFTSSTIARTFKKQTGMSVMEYKRAFRAGMVR